MNPKVGILFDDVSEYLLWAKLKFFEKGISPSEFKKCKMRDIKDILGIKTEIETKIAREREINNLAESMRK